MPGNTFNETIFYGVIVGISYLSFKWLLKSADDRNELIERREKILREREENLGEREENLRKREKSHRELIESLKIFYNN